MEREEEGDCEEMSTKSFCDKCGKEGMTDTVNLKVTEGYIISWVDPITLSSEDLCPSCKGKFIQECRQMVKCFFAEKELK